jgi:branched-chain amino acid aminotransferase
MMIYLGGQLVAAAEARVDPWDRGLTLGDGLFETIAVRAGRVARLEAHLSRLRDGGDVIGLKVPLGDSALAEAFSEVIEANGIGEGVLKLIVTRGPAPRGLLPPAPVQPTLLIAGISQELAPPEPATAVIATVTRRNEHSPLSRIKSLNALDNVLAAQEAARRNADEVLLLNGAGNLAEAAAANLFLVAGGIVITPPVHDGVLPGVMRADVIKALGVAERSLRPADLTKASEAFLTNSLGIRPLVSVDGVAIGDGQPGPVCKEAQKIV